MAATLKNRVDEAIFSEAIFFGSNDERSPEPFPAAADPVSDHRCRCSSLFPLESVGRKCAGGQSRQ